VGYRFPGAPMKLLGHLAGLARLFNN